MNKFIQFLCLLGILLSFNSCDTGGDPLGDALLEASAQGKLDQMKVCIDNGVDINYINPNMMSTQQTACMKAAAHGQMEALKWLVEQKADWHKATSGGENPITLGAKKGHFDIVYYLIEIGEEVNYKERNYGKTAFLYAAEQGELSAAKQLLAKGANLNEIDKEEKSAMHLAVRHAHPPIIEFLLEKGLKLNDQMLFEAVAHTSGFKMDKEKATLGLLLREGLNINVQNSDGDTPLHIANKHGNDPLIDFLRSKGADTKIKNKGGLNAEECYNQYKEERNS
jgi:ankyrin repeat protein